MDGRSIVPFIVGAQSDILRSTRQHLQNIGNLSAYAQSCRDEVFIEYYYVDYNTKCATGNTTPLPHNYPQSDAWCATLDNNSDCWSSPWGPSRTDECYSTEDPSNNFVALRRFEKGIGTLYAEYQTGNLNDGNIDFETVDFVEHYHVSTDPNQLTNLASDPERATERQELHDRLRSWLSCAGPTCPPVKGQESISVVI